MSSGQPAASPGASSGATSGDERALALGSGQMFDRIADRYDLLNRVLSMGIDKSWRRRTVRALALGDGPRRVLDVATGTADLALEIAATHPRTQVLGVDPSVNMLARGRLKVARRNLTDRIELVVGDAQALDHPEATFDAATIAFGIRNVPDRMAGLREMARVVRPGGRVCVLELGEPRRGLLARSARWYTHHVVPWLGGLLSGQREYRYLQRSIAAFPDAETFSQMMRDAGLELASVQPMMFGVCTLFVGQKPEATP